MVRKSDSDAVRRESVRKLKESFKEKEQLMRNALKSVDGPGNNKIIFDDDIEEQIDKQQGNEKKRTLFDDDERENSSNDEEFDFSDRKKPKIINLGNDPRFAVDERFLENTEENEKNDESHGENDDDDDGYKNEKNKELEILQSVLGKPIVKKNDKTEPAKRKNQMIRYDPNQDNHEKHELKQEIRQPKKKKVKINETKVEEEKPIPVSNEIFYSVAENLTETLKAPEEFSLLKQFGTAPEKEKNEEIYSSTKKSNFGENFDAKNPFKYDSSEDEDEERIERPAKKNLSEKKIFSSVEETFFLDNSIFKEAEEFFRTPIASNDTFKDLRKELKQLVRKKIQTNTRKAQAWKRKKINKPKKAGR